MHFEGICGLKTELNYPFKYIYYFKKHAPIYFTTLVNNHRVSNINIW